LAKLGATADQLSGGRFAVNVVSGWFKDDFTLKPKPLNTADRPNPELFQGGNSTAARRNGGYYADWYFSNGKNFDGVTEQLVDVRNHARDASREVKFGLNGFIIARDTEAEARDTLREIADKANRAAVEGFRAAVQQAGNSTSDRRGRWADSTFEDLVQYNDGFRTQLIGTPEQIAERIAAYRKRGGPDSRWLPALPGRDRVLRIARASARSRKSRTQRRMGLTFPCWRPHNEACASVEWNRLCGPSS
jgi:FMNH2-dependent dimethyl sulfone monooxygenase